MFFPIKIETLFKQWPLTNWLLMFATIVVFFLEPSLDPETFARMVLTDWSASGIFGHLLLHAGLLHLIGNLIFLWVFGNAVCGNSSNLVYPLLYAFFGAAAGAAHLLFGAGPAVGASGAINGVVGMALAMYPLNSVRVFWFVVVRAGTFEMPLWALALIWFVFDLLGAITGGGGIAYWAHMGGFLAGLLTGIVALRQGWVTLTKWDNASLVEIFSGKKS